MSVFLAVGTDVVIVFQNRTQPSLLYWQPCIICEYVYLFMLYLIVVFRSVQGTDLCKCTCTAPCNLCMCVTLLAVPVFSSGYRPLFVYTAQPLMYRVYMCVDTFLAVP